MVTKERISYYMSLGLSEEAAEWRRQFETEGAFAGSPWQPLSPAHALWKAEQGLPPRHPRGDRPAETGSVVGGVVRDPDRADDDDR